MRGYPNDRPDHGGAWHFVDRRKKKTTIGIGMAYSIGLDHVARLNFKHMDVQYMPHTFISSIFHRTVAPVTLGTCVKSLALLLMCMWQEDQIQTW